MFTRPPGEGRAAGEDNLVCDDYLGYVLTIGRGAAPLPLPPQDTGPKYPVLGYVARVRVPLIGDDCRFRGNVAEPYAYQTPHAEFLTFSCITPKRRAEVREKRSPRLSGARREAVECVCRAPHP